MVKQKFSCSSIVPSVVIRLRLNINISPLRKILKPMTHSSLVMSPSLLELKYLNIRSMRMSSVMLKLPWRNCLNSFLSILSILAPWQESWRNSEQFDSDVTTHHCQSVEPEQPLYLEAGEVGPLGEVLHDLLLLLLDRGGGASLRHPVRPDRPVDWRLKALTQWLDQNNFSGKT